MRFPHFNSITEFFVQSKHGLKIGNFTLSVGEQVNICELQPCTVRRLYLSKQIGSKDQVERHMQKLCLNNGGEFERSESVKGEDSSKTSPSENRKLEANSKKVKK
jgi:hypothetical protein